MNQVKVGPRQTRMGDIYHKIKQTVDKIAKSNRNNKRSLKLTQTQKTSKLDK